MKKYIIERQKRVPVLTPYDVVVIGGGIAGVSAAVSAARNGVKVCLVEKTGMLGGLATAGLVAYYLPLCDGYGKQLASGIAEELIHLSVKLGHESIPECWRRHKSKSKRSKERYQVVFNPASFAICLDDWVIRAGVDIRFESLVVDVNIKNQYIENVILEEKSGRYIIPTKMVIDASGDAIVAARTGVPIKEETNWLAAWYYLANLSLGTIALRKIGTIDPETDGPFGHNSSGIRKFSGICSSDISDFYILSRKLIADDVKKNRKKYVSRHNIFPITIPSIAQFRTTQHIMGLFQLDEKHDGKHFNDTIGIIGDWRKKGPVYRIPFRCLIPNGINNLLVAGRCVSATTSGLEIVRSIPGCAVTGQAAGVAASLAARNKIPVSKLNIHVLQRELKNQKVIV